MREGFYTDLSNEAYHADAAIGSSGIKTYLECPALYYADYLAPNRPPRKESAVQAVGSYAHIALLEPDIFEAKYLVAEKSIKNRVVKAWKEFEKEATSQGKEPILWTQFEKVCQMTATIKNHELANSMLSKGKAEMSFFAKDKATGLMIKARPDYLVNLNGYGVILVDYKTTTVSLAASKQGHLAFGLKRHLQAAHHKATTELATSGTIHECAYVTQMQEYPYLVRVFRMPEEAIAIGNDERRKALTEIAECHSKGHWPDYPHEIEDYPVPSWLHNEYN